ncbi:hypothetical protein HBI81_223020 [Parastagonospora nodorum]|nr:hypothetical protein HBH92_224810 [Parastagonospora nodorum]KAH4434711.1 hypothetical protein HBH93_122170 [Parastagonospora nodorum]KAH4446644.1 hypothetical protein HBH91_145400 [Parastagonospora nodorum]KAH4503930.1 hypothetical protein HBH89_095600 [Parastagonospora nodorum]KAH4527094.1 hypothetical protein HBH86_225240 [Parastagonospora nodorum]
MIPTVWIYCGSRKCKKKVDETILKIPYLQQFIRRFNLNPAHSSLHGPWPAASEAAPYTPFPEGDCLIVLDILPPSNGIQTACGLKARFTVLFNHQSATIDSTIGGTVVVDGRLYGLTTAHGIVNHILNHERGSRPEEQEDEQEDEGEKGEDTEGSSEYESDDTSSGGSQYSVQEKTRLHAARSERDGFQDKKKPQDSIRLELPKVLRYLDRGTVVGDYSLTLRSPATNQADFLLIDLEPAGPAAQRNFMHKQGGPLSILDHVPACDLVQGEVDIIAGNNGHPVKGYLLRGDTSLILRGDVIRTRKIQVEHPGAAGISGAWVVRNEKLCGIIYAAYETSPYLHMLSAESVFQEIQAMIPGQDVRVATDEDSLNGLQGSASVSKGASGLESRNIHPLKRDHLSEVPSVTDLIASTQAMHAPDHSELSQARQSHALPQAQPPQPPSPSPGLGRQHRESLGSAAYDPSVNLLRTQQLQRSLLASSFQPINDVSPQSSIGTSEWYEALFDSMHSGDVSTTTNNPPGLGYPEPPPPILPPQPQRCPTCSEQYEPPPPPIWRPQPPPMNISDYYAQARIEHSVRSRADERNAAEHYERWKQRHTDCSAPTPDDVDANAAKSASTMARKRPVRARREVGSLRGLGKLHFDASTSDSPWPAYQ